MRAPLLPAALLLLGLGTSTALAQGAPSLPPTLIGAPSTATVPLAADASLKRWPDGDAVVAELTAGTPVVVVLEDGDMVRVRHELEFGWVPKAALTAAEPADAAGE